MGPEKRDYRQLGIGVSHMINAFLETGFSRPGPHPEKRTSEDLARQDFHSELLLHFNSAYNCQMKARFYGRRLTVILLVAAVLLASLTHGRTSLSVAILVPFWFCLAIIVGIRIPRIEEPVENWLCLAFPVFSPRPPPVS